MVKKILIAILLLCRLLTGLPQTKSIDSIRHLLAVTTDKKQLVKNRYELARSFLFVNADSSFLLSSRAIITATNNEDPLYCCKSQVLMGDACFLQQNYACSIESYLDAFKTAKEINDEEMIDEVAGYLGEAYYDADDLYKSIHYLKLSCALQQKQWDKYRLSKQLCRIGFLFTELNKLDSAQKYYNESYAIARPDNTDQVPCNLMGFGIINYKSGNFPIAHGYLGQAFDSCVKNNNLQLGYQVASRIGRLFKTENKPDSSLRYYRVAQIFFDSLTAVGLDWPKLKLDFYKELAAFYGSIDSSHKAVKYYKLEQAISDSLFNARSRRSIQAYSIQTDEGLKKMERDRNHYLQNAAISVGIICFILLFFLLSRTMLVNVKMIRFLGVLLLLLVFEFLNLLLHPWLEKITGESQTLMLLALATIAAVLIPLHHKMEKWVTRVMVKKNTDIRLSTAKKILAEPGKPVNTVPPAANK